MADSNISPEVEEARPRRLEKGEWTLIVCIAVMLAGIPAHYLGLSWLRAACVYIGSAALIGAFTNRIAIHALFDPWPSRLVSLPYTGIIEIERKRIEQAIMNAVAERLITPEILSEELKEADSLLLLRDEAASVVRSLSDGGPAWVPDGAAGKGIAEAATAYSREVLERVLTNDRLLEALGTRMQEVTEEVLERPESFAMVRERFRSFAGPLGAIGHFTGVTDYDEVTFRILDGVRAELGDVWSDPERLRGLVSPWVRTAERSVGADPVLMREMRDFASMEFREATGRMADRLEQWDVRNSEAVDKFVDYAVSRFDVRQIVGRALNKLSTEEVKQLILKHSREHLGWLEVWGGVLGAAGGAILWALSPWL
jgi:hypothetical protein